MNKVLRPTTIIPQNLYVERQADRQLSSVIADMGRPGYILVARQMGKTNLLINMKRRFEQQGYIVSYFDLSNRHQSLQTFFRGIIDQLAEAINDSTLSDKIDTERHKHLEPNSEYDRHLRLILRSVSPRQIIIILDEVDSLVSTSYSDAFFAQIRSMYFSRANHSEYERLTYVLSGVAEPTDLIKDKAISPFNIGQKIYLEDFSKEEVQNLASASQLCLRQEIIDEVYAWTSGNPRMTWDLLSELEDTLIERKDLTKREVIDAVTRLYLNSFDRAPVDHIRVLAETDPLLRSGIASIRWGKGHTLDERAKSRLYLAGITSANTNSAPKIKNKIIDAALSDSWLSQASSKKSLLDVALEHFSANRFEAAVAHFEDYASQLGDKDAFKSEHRWLLGIAEYKLGHWQESIQVLSEVLDSTQEQDIVVSCNFHIGSALLQLGDGDASIIHLEVAALSDGSLAAPAKVNLQSALFLSSVENRIERILALSEQLLADLESDRVRSTEEKSELVCSSYFNIAQGYRLESNLILMGEYLDSALARAPASHRPALLLYKLRGEPNRDVKGNLAEMVAEEVVGKRLVVVKGSTAALNLREETLSTTLLLLQQEGREESFNRLLHYIVENIYAHARRPFDVLVHLARLGSEDRTRLLPLVWLAVEQFDDETVTPDHRLVALRALTSLSTGDARERAFSRYSRELDISFQKGQVLGIEDALTLQSFAQSKLGGGLGQEALEIVSHGLSLTLPLREEDLFSRIFLMYWKMTILVSMKRMSEVRTIAEELIALTANGAPAIPGYEGQEIEVFFKSVRDNALIHRPRSQFVDPYKHLGRNTRASARDNRDGRVVEDKFKKLESAIRSGRYTLIKSSD